MLRIRELLKKDDAVSPVIGVILMVAITVILAAVIASFVLGLGDQTDSVQPTAQLSFDFENEDVGTTSDLSGYPDGNTNSNYENASGTALDATGGGSSDDVGPLTITHESGDELQADELFIRGEGFFFHINNEDNDEITVGDGSSYEVGNTLAAGQSIEIAASDDYDLRVVWDPQPDDNSATLGEDSGPDA